LTSGGLASITGCATDGRNIRTVSNSVAILHSETQVGGTIEERIRGAEVDRIAISIGRITLSLSAIGSRTNLVNIGTISNSITKTSCFTVVDDSLGISVIGRAEVGRLTISRGRVTLRSVTKGGTHSITNFVSVRTISYTVTLTSRSAIIHNATKSFVDSTEVDRIATSSSWGTLGFRTTSSRTNLVNIGTISNSIADTKGFTIVDNSLGISVIGRAEGDG
jgi:hypothetical protein